MNRGCEEDYEKHNAIEGDDILNEDQTNESPSDKESPSNEESSSNENNDYDRENEGDDEGGDDEGGDDGDDNGSDGSDDSSSSSDSNPWDSNRIISQHPGVELPDPYWEEEEDIEFDTFEWDIYFNSMPPVDTPTGWMDLFSSFFDLF